MSKQEALSKGWQPTANFYAGSQIWKNGDKKGLYSPCLDLLTVIC